MCRGKGEFTIPSSTKVRSPPSPHSLFHILSGAKRELPSSENLNVFHWPQVSKYVSFRFWADNSKSSILLTSSIRVTHVRIVGGYVSLHCRTIHDLAALIRWRKINLLYVSPGMFETCNKNRAGSSGRLYSVNFCAIRRISLQKYSSFGQDQRTWSRVPLSSWHLQHLSGISGKNLLSNEGVRYHLVIILKLVSWILVDIEDFNARFTICLCCAWVNVLSNVISHFLIYGGT